MRGARITLHQHFDGTQELRWRKRKVSYTVLTKVQRQAAEADGKTVNTRVDNAMAKRNKQPGTQASTESPLEKIPRRQVRHRGA